MRQKKIVERKLTSKCLLFSFILKSRTMNKINVIEYCELMGFGPKLKNHLPLGKLIFFLPSYKKKKKKEEGLLAPEKQSKLI